jgi:hypothetical protein
MIRAIAVDPHEGQRRVESPAGFTNSLGTSILRIQLLLGHASVQTTERYLGTKQDLVHAPNDAIKLRVTV